jgi:hypothetical protein
MKGRPRPNAERDIRILRLFQDLKPQLGADAAMKRLALQFGMSHYNVRRILHLERRREANTNDFLRDSPYINQLH